MNCLECRERLQQRLDGEANAGDCPELARHLAVCSHCRELYAAARRLEDGIRRLPIANAPPGLSRRISGRILVERRQQLRRRRFAIAAAAAVLICLAGYLANRSTHRPSDPRPVAQQAQPIPSRSIPSLRQSVEEAGVAVVALSRRATDETVGQSRFLLPIVFPQTALPRSNEFQRVLEPSTQTLREVKDTVSEGLEPVATSARRAVQLFLREVPSLDRPPKSRM